MNELGTFLIVDPLVDPSELLDQLAIWWWPALEDHMFDVEVVTPDGPMTPRPAMLPVVAQFLMPYRIAKKEQEPQDPNREQYASSRRRNTNGAGGSDLSGLGLVVADDPIGMDGEPAEGTAVVALALRTLGVTSDRLPGHSLALTTAGRADSMPRVIVSKSPGEVRRWFRSDGPSRATSTRPLAASLPVNSRQTRPAR